jgi:hypothetical protein
MKINITSIKNILLAVMMVAISGIQLMASSHREAPLIANDPLADNVDVYAFRSPDNPDMITMIATYVPLQLPQGGPNYYSFGENIRYEIHVDNDASVVGDEIVYRFTFTITNEDPTTFFNIRLGQQNQKATYNLERSMDGGASFTTIISNGVVPPNNIGPRSIESSVGLGTTYDALFNDAITTASTGETVFAGPTDDPFFVDLGGIFDLGDAPRQDGTPVDGVACYNVSALAIQVPISTLLKEGAPATPTSILDSDYVIGVWASASRPAVTTLSATGDPTVSGDWIQVSRLGMPLTNEAVIPIGDKDEWNALTPYNENPEHYEYFYNPELALYMDDDQFGAAVPAFAPLRVQTNSLGMFDFSNGADGLFGLKGNPALDGTALDDAVFGTLLLPEAGKPRSVDLWPAFHTGVPNVIPYQLATGKDGNPLAAGKPFVNNFLPNGGDMLRLNMAVPPTPRDDANFSSLGLIQAAAIGLTVAPFNTTADLEFIPNMDGFPNGRRLEDDVTRIELQAVAGVVLAAVGLWYDDFDPATSPSPVTDDLLGVLTYTTGVESNDRAFTGSFPYLAQPNSGTGACSGEIILPQDDLIADPSTKVFVSSNNSGVVATYGFDDAGNMSASTFSAEGNDADGIFYDEDADVVYQLNRSENVINAYSNVQASLTSGGTPTLTATSTSDFTNGREIAVSGDKLVVAQDAADSNGQQNSFIIYTISPTSITLDRVVTTDINLWGMTFNNNTLMAIVDNSSDVGIFPDFLATATGSVSPARRVTVDGIVRTHGIAYDVANDVMVLTDVGSGAVDNDGTLVIVNGWSTASSDNSVTAAEQIVIAGASTFLGNPVDVAYDHTAQRIYVAERLNGGGRFLIFDVPATGGDIAPIANDFFMGASAVSLTDCRVVVVNDLQAINDFKLFLSSNNSSTAGVFGYDNAGNVGSATWSVVGEDADGIYYDEATDVVYQLNRSDNVINAYSNVVASLTSGGTPTLTATSTSDFTNGREIAVSGNKLVVAQDAADSNGMINQLVTYTISPTSITLDKIQPVNIALWGITFGGDDLFAVVDVSSNIAIYNDFLAQPAGMITQDRLVSVPEIVRTHGITYDVDNDVMVLTDVGSGAVDDDGAIIVVNNWSTAIADSNVSGAESTRIIGSATFLGNPVDVAYDHPTQQIFVAERLNGGGRYLVFNVPTSDGNFAPTANLDFAGASAIHLTDCREPVVGGDDPVSIVNYNLDACNSFTNTQTNIDYSEFVPAYPNALSCASVVASNVSRAPAATNPHSCTPGVGGSVAMCVESFDSCTYTAGNEKSVIFNVTLSPTGGDEASLSQLTFFEKAPEQYDWISGPSGPNNYPTLYGVRVLKDGVEVLRSADIPTNRDWTLQTIELTGADFTVTSATTFTFELLPYCLVGNGATVDAWDIDEVNVLGVCGASGNRVVVEGTVATEMGTIVENVKVGIESNQPNFPVYTSTDESGEYAFSELPAGFDYMISGQKNDDYLNGVSTLDIVMIQRHILGKERLDSPYKLLAADVNQNSSITAIDLIEIRKLILGITDEFPMALSWGFVDGAQTLNTNDPFSSDQFIFLPNLDQNFSDKDLVAVKYGDVNNDVTAGFSSGQQVEKRTDKSLDFMIDDRAVERGQTYEIPFRSTNFNEVLGFQFSLELNGVTLNSVSANAIDLTESNMGHMSEEIHTVSWANVDGLTAADNDQLFTINVTAQRDGNIADMLQINSAFTPIEAYTDNNLEKVDIKLFSNGGDQIIHNQLYQNMPNPFSDLTQIKFNTAEEGIGTITIFDVTGKVVYSQKAQYNAGTQKVIINKADIQSASGILYYRLDINDYSATRKMTLIN